MVMEFGPLGCIINEDYTLAADQNIAQATGESVFFDESPSVAEFNGRWEYLKSRGVMGVFLFEGYEKIRSLVPHDQRSGTCVGRGTHMAVQHSYYNALASGVAIGDGSIEIAWEPYYIGSRVYIGKSQLSGEGSVGAWAAEWAAGINGIGGACLRQPYSNIDLTLTNERWAVANSNRGGGLPADILAACQKHTCRVHRVRNNKEIADSIASKFAVARCWNTLFGPRDSNGFSRPAGSGAHCEAVVGVFVMTNGKTGFVELNSWGENQPSGPRTLKYAGGEILLPKGCYAVTEDDFLRAQQARFWEAWSFAFRKGEEFR